MQRLYPWENGQFGSKVKIAKKMRKTTLQVHWKCSMQETVRKNSQYWRNEMILKIGKNDHHAKAIAVAKWSGWVKNLKCEKHTKNTLQAH